MRFASRRALQLTPLLAILLVAGALQAERPDYPPTRSVSIVERIHGTLVRDPYRWLENGDDPQVQAWTQQQNALTRRYLDQFGPERAALTKRLETLYADDVSSPPQIFGTRYFFAKRLGQQNHFVLYVLTAEAAAEPKVLLDPNTLSTDGSIALDWWYPSPDGRLVAYGLSSHGSEQSTLHVIDVDSAADTGLTIPRTRHAVVAWDADGGGFCYARHPEPGSVAAGDENYYRRIYHHTLRTSVDRDTLVWGQNEPKEAVADVSNTGDYRYQLLTVYHGWGSNDLYIRPAAGGAFRPIAVGLDAFVSADVLGDRLIIHTDHEAPRAHVLVTNVAAPEPANWHELIPEQKGVIADVIVADGKLIVHVMENAYSRVLIYDQEGQLIKEIELPTLGHVDGLTGRPDRPELFFSFESFAYPPVVYRYDLRSHTMDVFDRLAEDLDFDSYETRQVWFNSKDGTRVPMFLTHRKGLTLNGDNPTVLWGYGGFDISQTPNFYRAALPWLDAGGIWAVANVRGGGEFGQAWHRAGQLENKQNCFDDFIAAAEKLIADGYTRRARLGAGGQSNGGLLAGAMIVQRPDLFQAVYGAVPLLDMVRYHLFAIARLWIPEYGSAEDAEAFKYLYAYSPYHHVQSGVAYPAILLTAGDTDTRVDPLHACKMTAALQACTVSNRPVLLRVRHNAGHGAGKPLTQYIEDQVDEWLFFMWQLGVLQPGTETQPAASRPTGSY